MARKTKTAALATNTEIVQSTAAASTKRRRKALTAEKSPETPPTLSDTDGKLITGKLGILASAVGKPDGATIDELVDATGWQRHTVRAALTRLRQRGIDATLMTVDDRKAYRISATGA